MIPAIHGISISARALGVLAFLAISAGAARAGDTFQPESPPDQSHCKALGEGFFAVKGSDACLKISGYITAGTGFAAGRVSGAATGVFAARPGDVIGGSTSVGMDARFDSEMGPGRLYVQVGHSADR